MLIPANLATLPRKAIALRGLLLQREAEHTAEQERQAAKLQAARNGLQEQMLRNEQLKLRLARLLRDAQYNMDRAKRLRPTQFLDCVCRGMRRL